MSFLSQAVWQNGWEQGRQFGYQDAFQRIRSLHYPSNKKCKTCKEEYPCQTIKVLDGLYK